MAEIISSFDRRSMNGYYKNTLAPSNFLRRIYFPKTVKLPTPKLERDFKKSKRIAAPFVSPKVGGKLYTDRGFDLQKYSIPTVGTAIKLSAEDEAFTRGLGQNPYALKQAYQKVADYLDDQNNQIARKEQLMIAELLTTGKFQIQEVDAEGANLGEAYEVNFGMTNIHKTGAGKFADSKPWTDPTSDPIEDLKKLRKEIWQKTGLNPRVVTLSPDVATIFIDHSKVKEVLNTRRVELGNIKPETLEPGVVYLGYINALGQDFYEYQDYIYDEKTQAEKEVLKEGSVIMGTTQNEMLYGAIALYSRDKEGQISENALPDIFTQERVADSWREGNKTRVLETLSKPLPFPTDIDSFAYLDVTGVAVGGYSLKKEQIEEAEVVEEATTENEATEEAAGDNKKVRKGK